MAKPIEPRSLSQSELQNKYTTLGYAAKRGVWSEDYFGERHFPNPSSSTATVRKRYVNVFGDNGRIVLVLIEFFHADNTVNIVILQLVEETPETTYKYSYDATKD
jgi:hypothetical protein